LGIAIKTILEETMARRDSVRDQRRRRPSRRYLPALAGSLTLAGTLTGVTGLAPAHATVTACQWRDGAQPAHVTTDGTLVSVTAPSATDAWAVGSTTDSNGDEHALIEHWNGSAWTIAPVPGMRSSSLLSVRSASRTSVWAVGEVRNAKRQDQTLILHWNGKAWARQPSPDPGGSFDILYGVRAVSATSAWAVGTFEKGSALRSLVLHWNGTAWKQVASPSPAIDSQFAGVAATSAASAWAVGLVSSSSDAPRRPGPVAPAVPKTDPRTFIARWNGHSWSQTASPSPGDADILRAVGTTSATSAWAVGMTEQAGIEQTLILHGDGQAWKRVASPDPAGGDASNDLDGVFATSAGNAWAVGNSDGGSFVLHWDGHSWQGAFGPFAFTDLFGVAGSSAGNAWAVGTVTNGDGSMPQPFALHCT
jgi:hypothetical protein